MWSASPSSTNSLCGLLMFGDRIRFESLLMAWADVIVHSEYYKKPWLHVRR